MSDPPESVPEPKELRDFLSTFDYHAKNDEMNAVRVKKWRTWDPNGNGYVSLAETDRAIRAELETAFPVGQAGTRLWRRFRPSFIRAFADAGDVAPARRQTKKRQLDDVIFAPVLPTVSQTQQGIRGALPAASQHFLIPG